MQKRELYILVSIFLIIAILRITLAFLTPNFTYESYFHLRQAQHIAQTGTPLYTDPLSYGGREYRFLPVFHYLLAFTSLLIPLEITAKILPNLLIASLTIITYLIATKITDNKNAPLYTALIAGFLPILYYTNDVTVETLFLPLLFLCIYAFLNIQTKKYFYSYLLLFFLLCFTSSATFLLLIGFGIYIILSFTEGKKIDRAELETILFSCFFFLWSQILFFKKNFLAEGSSFIWHNIPNDIILQYFPKFSLAQSLVLVSIVPFLIGIYVVYRSLFQLKTAKSFLLISFVISTTLLTWFRLLPFKTTLAFFGLILSILFASFYQEVFEYIQKMKISNYHHWFSVITIIILIASMIFPSLTVALNQDTPSSEEISAFRWLEKNTEPNSNILASLKEGHLLTYYSHRKNIIDDQFALEPDIDTRLADINTIFSSSFQTQALSLTDKYNIQYLVITSSTQQEYTKTPAKYITKQCFYPIAYQNQTKIYKIRCSLRELS